MKRARGLRLVLLALCVVLFPAACGGQDSNAPETLILASFSQSGSNRAAVNQFNRTHADIQIEVLDYYSQDYQEFSRNIDRFLTEIAAGNLPDIIDMGSARLPYRKMARRGYLEDLLPYIENDPDLGREDLMEAPIEAAEIDGGLYFAFDSVAIDTVAGAAQIVGERISWTLEELQEAFAAMPEDSTVLAYYFNKSDTLRYVLSGRLDTYIDWDAGRCAFDCADFRSVLEFVDSFPEKVEIIDADRLNEEILLRKQEGRQMLELTYIIRPHDIQRADIEWSGRASFVGYPVADGSTGSKFAIAESKLALCTGCKNKEAAWEFIREKLLPKYGSMEEAVRGYADKRGYFTPINRADYEKMKEVSMRKATFADNSSMHAVTEEEIQRFEELFNSIERVDLTDYDLLNVISDAAAPYFAGDKTLDETITLIQNRVSLYVNENL